MIRVRGVLAAALALAAAWPVWADFGAGQAAFDAGRLDEAVAEWRSAATSGDARAMLALGRLHALRGVDAPQNYVEAHIWLNLAAGRGDAAAAAERDALAGRMTAEQVARAQDRAARWRSGGPGADAHVGETFRDCPDCPEMVVVPAGSFMMGSPPSEKLRDFDEGPVHRVAFAAPFAVGVHEVTFAEWYACVSAGGCGGDLPDLAGGRGSRPIVGVSWNDAQSYVGWLSRSTGEDYRLLSESEWEYVARAGTSTPYWWGDDIGRDRAHCCRGGEFEIEFLGGSAVPVGSFAANAFGLHDVHGNVREWTQDCWNRSYAGAPGDGTAWERGECSRRVVRDGSWFNYLWRLRSAYRSYFSADYRNYNLGFRVARTFTP